MSAEERPRLMTLVTLRPGEPARRSLAVATTSGALQWARRTAAIERHLGLVPAVRWAQPRRLT